MQDSGDPQSARRIVVLSGPSGCGKSTLVDRLVETAPVRLIEAISATTRPPRPGEIDGKDYYFLSNDDFESRRLRGDFLEYAEVHGTGYWYGTLKSEVERAGAAGAWALLEIDVHGALQVIEQHPQAVTIFVTTPSEQVYEDRLRGRGTESEENIQRRLQTAREELKLADRYQYQVVNDDLERAIHEISDILVSVERDGNA